MGGILHLHPVQCDFQTRRSIELLTRSSGAGVSIEVRSVGACGDFRSLTAAARALRSIGNSRRPTIHAWGPTELIAAAVAGCPRIIFSPQAPPPRKWARWVGVILRRWPIEIVCPTRALCNHFVDLGMPASRCHAIYPAVDTERIRAIPSLRAELGFADSDIVLLAPGESDRGAAHRNSLWSAAILNVLDERFRFLTWGRGLASVEVFKFAQSLRQQYMLVQAERKIGREIEFEHLVSAADLAIVSAKGFMPTLPIQICLAAGLPIVASASPTMEEILQDNATALLDARSTPRTLAQRVMDLLNDSALRRKIIQGASDAAPGRFSPHQFIAEWKDIYTRLGANGVVSDATYAGSR